MIFNLLDEKKVDLTVIPKSYNITPDDILNNLMESIIKENLPKVYQYLKPDIFNKMVSEMKKCYKYNIKFGIMNIIRIRGFSYLNCKSHFTKNIFICPKCGNIYLLDDLIKNKYECLNCYSKFEEKAVQEYQDKYIDIRINDLIKRCVEVRKEKKITQRELVKYTGYSHQSIISL